MTLPSADIEALALKAAKGDEAAFTALVTATIDDVRLFVALRLSALDAVEEVVQTTYIACWQSLGVYRAEQPFLPWLRGIASNRLARVAREHQRGRRQQGGDRLLTLEVLAPDEEGDDPTARDALVALRRCLAALSAEARALLDAYYRDGQALIEIGAERQRRPGAVAATLHRTRQVLRQCLERQGVKWCSIDSAGSAGDRT